MARRTDDNSLREKTAVLWSKIYNADIKPEQVNCDGCTGEGTVHFAHCSSCEIRKCAVSRNVQNCAYCDDYGCEKLKALHDMVPEAKELLDEIRSKINN